MSIRIKGFQKPFSFLTRLVCLTLAIIFIVFVVGCDDDGKKADRAQAQLAKANQNIEEMKQLDAELISMGVPLNFESEDVKTTYFQIKKANLPIVSAEESLKLKVTLEAYIKRGEETLLIAEQGEVQFRDRERLKEQLATAKAWIELLFPTYSLSHQEN